MIENSGHLGVVDQIERSFPMVQVWLKEKERKMFEVHEDDIVFVLRENLVIELQAIDLISGDKILSIVPRQLLIEKSTTSNLF